jgi:nucleoporin POM152
MEGTPRLRSAFPNTPQRDVRDGRDSRGHIPAPRFGARSSPAQQKRLPQIPTLTPRASAASRPLISETVIDAPSQRLYAVAFWVALWTWRLYDFSCLQDSEEQSLWLFLKWALIDGIFLFGLPGLQIPWLEWSPATMSLIFVAHAFVDGMLMFRVPIPLGAGIAFLWRGVWGAYETAVNEHNVNPDTIRFNDTLILGRQIIHILPEGAAIMNPERETFCIDEVKVDARLPIMINATNPIAIDILRVDLDTQVNETLHISKSQIKTMHKEASRLLSYSSDPNEPKTLYYTVKKPGLYALQKVVDETNLEVSRKKLAHTVVVPCPKAAVLETQPNKCRGELAHIELEAIGTPPLKIKYRKVVNKNTAHATFENIQPEDFLSPLARQVQSALVVPNNVKTEWAKTAVVKVPLSEGMTAAGKWVYAIDEVIDGFGNVVSYGNREKQEQDPKAKSSSLHKTITVHERPNVYLKGCSPQRPLKVAKGLSTGLPLQYGSSGRGELDSAYKIEYMFSPQSNMASTGEHGTAPQTKEVTVKNTKQQPEIHEPGLYTITRVSSDFCPGEVLEPASCLLENPPEPQLLISHTNITDKCAGRPIGLHVELDLVGTPPFEIKYKTSYNSHHETNYHRLSTHRGTLDLTPREAGQYIYEFEQVSDGVYKAKQLPRVKSLMLTQNVKPLAYARINAGEKRTTCIDRQASFDVTLVGTQPFNLEYEVVHNGKRKKYSLPDVNDNVVRLETEPLTDGGDYTLGLVSITDQMGCKELLEEERKFTVRHQKPKVGFGYIDAGRSVNTHEGDKVHLPLRLVGEPPWNVKYLDSNGKEQVLRATNANDKIVVDREGVYKLLDVFDASCPGLVDDSAKEFTVSWIPRPELRIAPNEIKDRKGNTFIREEVCQGDEDAVEVLFKGSPPFTVNYVQHVKPEQGAVTPKHKELRAAVGVASLRLDTSLPGLYEYKFSKLADTNYADNQKHFTPLTIQQKVNSRPSAAFTTPGKTYGFCSVESDGEEVIPVKLVGQPPFELEVEIKHHGTIKPELAHYNNIDSLTHNIRIPHSRMHLGKSAVSLRRISDARGCTRSLDSTTPRVQISVHDAPTITPLETTSDYCVGDRLNFALSGVAPFQVFYTFEGAAKKATVSSGNTFRRLAEKPGTFIITGLQDSASACRATTNITKHIHGMPSVRVSRGKDSYVDIHEGGQAEILFEFGGQPPFEFTYTRSSNSEKGGKKGVVLDMRSESSEEHSMRIFASEEGTYEVVSIKDAHCAYTKPGVKVEPDKRKRLTY